MAPPSRTVSCAQYEAGLKSDGDGVGLTGCSNLLSGWAFSPFGSLEATPETRRMQPGLCVSGAERLSPEIATVGCDIKAAFGVHVMNFRPEHFGRWSTSVANPPVWHAIRGFDVPEHRSMPMQRSSNMVDPHCRKCRTAYNNVSDALRPLTNGYGRTQYNRGTSNIDAGGMIAWLSNAQY